MRTRYLYEVTMHVPLLRNGGEGRTRHRRWGPYAPVIRREPQTQTQWRGQTALPEPAPRLRLCCGIQRGCPSCEARPGPPRSRPAAPRPRPCTRLCKGRDVRGRPRGMVAVTWSPAPPCECIDTHGRGRGVPRGCTRAGRSRSDGGSGPGRGRGLASPTGTAAENPCSKARHP